MTVSEKRTVAEKEFGKKIEKYLRLKKNQTPDPEYCPTLYLTWNTQKDGRRYKNIQTGKFITNLSERIRISNLSNWKGYYYNRTDNGEYLTKPNVNYYCRYVKPDYNLGIIEFSSITIDTKRTNGPTAFTFLGSRVFMSMDDRTLWAYKEYTEVRFTKPTDYVYRVPQCYYRQWYFTQFKLKTYISDNKACCNAKVRKELYQYLQHNNINSYFNGRKEVDISTYEDFGVWNFCEWLTAKKVTRKAIDKEALIKTILSAEFSEIALTRDDLKSMPEEDSTTRYYGVVKHEKWQEYDVFRFFSPIVNIKNRYSNHSYERVIASLMSNSDTIDFNTLHWKEDTRIFIHDKKLHILERRYNSKDFSYITAPNALNYAKIYNVHIPDIEKIKSLDIFKYISDEIQEYTGDFSKYFIMLRKPIIEQLRKIDCPTIADDVSMDNQVAANLKEFVGEVNAKKKTIKEIFGMTTKQIQYIESSLKAANRGRYYSYSNFTLYDIGFLYELFTNKPYYSSLNDISNIDFETFKNAVDATINLKTNNSLERYWNWRWCRNDGTLKYATTFSNLCPDDIDPQNRHKYIIKTIKMCKKANVTIQIIADNHRMFNQLNNEFRPENMKLEYNCPSDITRIHDALVELIAAQDAEQARINAMKQEERNKELEKKMAKLDEKRKEFEYEDDTYMIRIPKKLSELTTEGTVQRICIGSYINAHARGNSNIYFLRKKSNPDTPFFAIEEKGGRIIQIHGYGNKWLGADDDSFAAVPFVRRWLRDKKISCDVRILTSKARGYSCGNEFREVPII